jgi:post-segregation antitoxin (ccd killing protein)
MATVSAKIPEELKRELDDAEVNVSDVIRGALEEEVRRRRRERVVEEAAEVSKEFDVEDEEIARIVRKSRDKR